MWRKGLPGLLTVAAALAGAATAGSAQFDSSLVSRATGGVKANGETRHSSISADGRYVTFQSQATNLSSDDNNGGWDVYLRDRQTGETTLVSRAANGDVGNGDDTRPMVSGDGRYVVFESTSTNLPGDADATADVFVRDLQTNTTILVSRATDGTKGNLQSFRPSISADGDRVAFQSSANNLDDDSDANGDVFVRDLSANTLTLVSRATAGANANGESDDPSISADGNHVAFQSAATNLDTVADPTGDPDVYVRDLTAATTTLASRATGATGAKGTNRNDSPSISGDGSRVVFHSQADNLGGPDDTSTDDDIYVRDLTTLTTTLVSRATGPTGPKGGGIEPAISRDGNSVAFTSFKANLDPDDLDTNFDVFLRDLAASTTTLVSRATGATGDKGGNGSETSQSGAHVSSDGRFVSFDSTSQNLSPDDLDAVYDVYVRQTGADAAPVDPGPGPGSGPGPGPAGPAQTIAEPARTTPPADPPSPEIAIANRAACLSVAGVVRDQKADAPGGGKVFLVTRQVDDPAHPLRTSVRATGAARIRSVTFKVNGKAVTASGARAAAATAPVSVAQDLLRLGSKAKRNQVVATVVLASGKKVKLTQYMIILKCNTPVTSCTRLADPKTMRCTSRTPLGGRRVRITASRTTTEVATGSATVTKGKYTTVVRSRVPLSAGTYAYEHVVTTKQPRQRYYMIRKVTVT